VEENSVWFKEIKKDLWKMRRRDQSRLWRYVNIKSRGTGEYMERKHHQAKTWKGCMMPGPYEC